MGNIRQSLRQLATETGNSSDPTSTNFSRDVRVVDQSVAKILAKPVSQRTVGERTALRALEYWSSDPSSFATTTTRPATNGMAELSATDSNGADLKCNRFVAEVATEAGFSFPLKLGWNGQNPRTAEKIYTDGIPNTTTVNAKNAKIGDIISFPGHVGIYLGNGLYASARSSTNRLGTQVNDGVQVTRVPWDKAKVYRMNENQLSSSSTGTDTALTGTTGGTGTDTALTGTTGGTGTDTALTGTTGGTGTDTALTGTTGGTGTDTALTGTTGGTGTDTDLTRSLAARIADISNVVDPGKTLSAKELRKKLIENGSNSVVADLAATNRAVEQGLSVEQAVALVEVLKQSQLVST
jgi:hypothetical protein